VLDPRLVWQMNSIMGDVIRQGTGRKALELKREDIAGKTGTTNEVRDSWFCGYQKDLVAVSWMGFDDFSPLGKGETGGQAGHWDSGSISWARPWRVSPRPPWRSPPV
jgi:penicillin-binding protein 1A